MVALFLGNYLKPSLKSISVEDMPNFSKIVPESFGEWVEVKDLPMVIADPEMEKTIDKIYNQTLNKTYKNADGKRIMLSIAYGVNQSDSMQAHKPEVCYPAQGFVVKGTKKSVINVSNMQIPVKLVDTEMGSLRNEFVLYWILVGDKATSGGMDRKLQQLSYGLKGIVPDGLLFRVSSIGQIAEEEYQLQEKFVIDLINSVPEENKILLIGVP
jgi:EpsI family protein